MIRLHAIPMDREETTVPSVDRALIGNFYFALVAICHQTSPKNRPPLEGTVRGQFLRGWDYLSARFEEYVSNDASLLSPKRWRTITADDLRCIFRDAHFGDRLSDSEGRAKLVVNLGELLLQRGADRVDELYEAAQHRIASGPAPLIEALSRFRAYDDPVRKKTYFFLALMQNTSSWTYVDPESLGAPVDYHEVRGHLRIGTVLIQDSNLRERILKGEP
jgi:hypothetical protein